MIYEQISSIIEDWESKEVGICYCNYDENDDENDDEIDEVYIDDELRDVFIENNIEQYQIAIDEIFENSGITIYSVSIAWVENQRLRTIMNRKIYRV